MRVATGAGGVLARLAERRAVPPCSRNHPVDPIRARCRSARIHHRVAGGISRLVPVRGPLPDISVHIKKAPWVGRILPHIAGLFKIVPSLARHPNYNSHSNWQLYYPMSTPWSSRTAGIFPLRFGGQHIGPAHWQSACCLLLRG